MNYNDQLQTENWSLLREEILVRDGYSCKICGNNKYLHDLELTVGILNAKKHIFAVQIEFRIHVFGNDSLKCKIRSEINNKLTSPSILFFTINDENWIDLIASRELTQHEFSNYIDTLEPTKVNNLPSTIEFNSDWRGYKWTYVKGLHVHHNYYQSGKLAWEYPIEALTTLCWSCHKTLHESSEIEVRDAEGNFAEYRTACYRCYGAGWFPEHKHVEQGICFRCRGTKFEEK